MRCMLAVILLCSWAHAEPPELVTGRHVTATVSTVTLNLEALAAATGTVKLQDVPLPGAAPVDLLVSRFELLAPDARVVIAGEQGEVEIEPAPILFLRGQVAGRAGSHVFISLSPGVSTGRIELGAGHGSFAMAGNGNQVRITRTRALPGLSAPCPVQSTGHAAAPANLPPTLPDIRSLRQVEMGVEGDYELFSLFESEVEAVTYMLQVYGAVGDIMLRDLNLRLDLVFLRLWTTPDDPWGDGASWSTIPNQVFRDYSQLLSGTRDVGAGGLAQLCGPRSWVGFSLGAFEDPSFSNVNNQDIIICAHELGHCLGSPHTHDMGVDECDDAGTPTQRGSIISYCYYFSGGYANTDMRYHVAEQERIVQCLAGKQNVVFDCNQNRIDDALDVANGTSEDANANGIPDECEDCNANGVLDDIDIFNGDSLDVNVNGIPDECEPDCNANGIPDSHDIATGTSLDLYGNGVPDECEADCNANGVSDYTEIQLDMTLDIDRDAILDACQDCDLDGVSDLETINGANSIWAVASSDKRIREYHPITGVLMRSSEADLLDDPRDILITPDARILVSSAGEDNSIVEFDRTGAFVRVLAIGAMDDPGAMLSTGDGRLLVAGSGSNNIVAFDIDSGELLGVLVEPDDIGPLAPYGLALAPNGHLLVGTADARVIEYDAHTGEFIRELITTDGGLLAPRDLVVLPDQRLLVADEDLNGIMAFDATTGQPLGVFNYGSFNIGLSGAWGLAQAGNGYVYATGSDAPELFHLTDPRMLMYDPDNGFLIRTIVQRPDSQLNHGRGIAFMAGDGDCNRNLVPDACDIDAGVSQDANANGVPDECEDLCPADINADGELSVLDFVFFQLAWKANDPVADCNHDGAFDVSDFVCFQNLFTAGCD